MRIRAAGLVVAMVGLVTAIAALPAVGAGRPSARTTTPRIESDFNGDGFADLAIGIPGATAGSVANSGAVHVLYGSSTGLSSTDAQRFTQADPGVPGDPAGGAFGTRLATGDFDGDGFADLAVAAPFQPVGGHNGAGTVTVLYGSSIGLSTAGSQLWNGNSAGLPGVAHSNDVLGFALTASNFGNGAQDDLAIAEPDRDVSGVNGAGAVLVLYGSASGLRALHSQVWTESSSGFPGVPTFNDGIGQALASGNVGRSAQVDLAIGAAFKRHNGHPSAGEVFVLYGGLHGLSTTGVQAFTEESLHVPGGSADNDRFGSAVAIGDFGRGTTGDLAIGVNGRTVNSQFQSGLVRVLYGTTSGLSTTGIQSFSQGDSGTGTTEAGDQFGAVMVAANFGRGSQDDLAIGVPAEAVGSATDAGSVSIVYGSSSGLTFSGAQGFTQPDLNVGVAETGDVFGAALYASNFGNGPQADLAIGVPDEDIGSVQDAGAADVAFGSGSGVVATNSEGWSEDNAGAGEAATAGNRFGSAVG
ncbi:MAG: FG-GAP-like repeat-containing protein [Actinomycetota bacterium]